MAKIKKEQLEKAIRNKVGLISFIAQGLDVTPKSIYAAIKRYHLEDVLDEARETTMDLAESQLINAIRDGNLSAVFFYLKTIGRKRGFVEKGEIEQTGDILINLDYDYDPEVKRQK